MTRDEIIESKVSRFLQLYKEISGDSGAASYYEVESTVESFKEEHPDSEAMEIVSMYIDSVINALAMEQDPVESDIASLIMARCQTLQNIVVMPFDEAMRNAKRLIKELNPNADSLSDR